MTSVSKGHGVMEKNMYMACPCLRKIADSYESHSLEEVVDGFTVPPFVAFVLHSPVSAQTMRQRFRFIVGDNAHRLRVATTE